MLCKEIIEKTETFYPAHYAMEWDNTGLLAGRYEKEVERVYVALDLTDEVLADAVNQKTDMIITHHPLLFSAVKSVTDSDFTGRRLMELIRNDISYYAMHTNYDVVRMAGLAAEMLGLTEVSTLQVLFEDGKGIGCTGFLESSTGGTNAGDLCRIVKERFGLETVKLFGNPEKKVMKAAVCPGSGKSVLKAAVLKGADVLVTGDIGHHEGIDAVADGMAVIDAGHYGLEHIYMEDMKQFFGREIPELIVQTAKISHPFQVC